MPTSDDRMRKAVEDIARSMDRIVKVLDTLNSNMVLIGRDLAPLKQEAVDIDKLAEDVQKLRAIKQETDEALQPAKLEVGQRVCNMDKSSHLYLHEGKIVRFMHAGAIVHYDGFDTPNPYPIKERQHLGILDEDVSYKNHICGGPEYCVVCREGEQFVQDANQLEIPALIDDEKIGPNKFIPDDQGRLYPSEWRHNLGINTIRVMKPDSPALAMNENRRFTREQFEDYNEAAYAAGVIMNEEDAEGTPDSRGRLKPYEWRQKFNMPQIDCDRERAHAFDEKRLMTEEDFRAYNAKLENPDG